MDSSRLLCATHDRLVPTDRKGKGTVRIENSPRFNALLMAWPAQVVILAGVGRKLEVDNESP